MESEPTINFTVSFIHSSSKDILLNITDTSDANVAFENMTAVLINISNETFAELLGNLTFANNTVSHPQHLNISDFHRTLSKITVGAGYVYMLLTILGVVLNAGVLIRLAQLAYSDYDRFHNGCGLPLAAMSAADLTSLMSIIVTVVLSTYFPPYFFASWARSLQCKAAMFLIHAMTGFSTWCWLLVSALRYMAVYHPLWQISRWKFGYGTLISMLFIILLMNSWLLFSVVGHPHVCGEIPLTTKFDLNRIMHGFELFVNYILPAILTFALDVRVLFTRPPEFLAISTTSSMDFFAKRLPTTKKPKKNSCCPKFQFLKKIQRENSKNSISIYTSLNEENYKNKKPKQHSVKHHVRRARSAVIRWLTITTIGLLLNAPDNFLRIASIASGSNSKRQNSASYHLIALVSRLLYFAQFCFNAFYLSTIIYKRNVETSKSRQQRLRHERKIWCRNCSHLHEAETKCNFLDSDNKQNIRRRFSEDPRLARPSSTTPKTETDNLPMNELVRAPSLPLIGDASRLTSSVSIHSDSDEFKNNEE
ncbi:hypothetical protein FO519_005859 [Halicephalobus sp. NKZ332]|nr:hypothetical protein FO519_005859 [Halicephalobus sp. NKZ332]